MHANIRPFWLLCFRWFAHLICPWEGSNYPIRSCNGPNGPKEPKLKKCACSLSLFSFFPSFISIPRRPLSSGPGGRRPPGKMRTSSPLPESGDHRWPVGCKPCHVHWVLTLVRLVCVRPGDVHFFQDHCHRYPLPTHPPIPYPYPMP